MLEILKPLEFEDYELIDSGNGEKLERFGKYILSRPEPQAVWDKSMAATEWAKMVDATFVKEKGNPEKGIWTKQNSKIPEKWEMKYKTNLLDLTFKISLSSFKHVGLFPEQASNWDYIAQKLSTSPISKPKFLNLFAYTGVASLAANQLGAEVYHVDSIKQTISWAKDNMELSGLDNIRWVVEDALKFVKREQRRERKYDGIILDPPAYGRGADGERWILEESINEMIKICAELLQPKGFLILNLYSMGFSALILENLINTSFKRVTNPQLGELYLEDRFNKKLPLGVFFRFG